MLPRIFVFVYCMDVIEVSVVISVGGGEQWNRGVVGGRVRCDAYQLTVSFS